MAKAARPTKPVKAKKPNGSKPKRPPGRPSSFTQVVADRLCEELARGKSLRSICEAADMPSWTSVYRWLEANPVFRQQYARSREMGIDAIAQLAIDEATSKIAYE